MPPIAGRCRPPPAPPAESTTPRSTPINAAQRGNAAHRTAADRACQAPDHHARRPATDSAFADHANTGDQHGTAAHSACQPRRTPDTASPTHHHANLPTHHQTALPLVRPTAAAIPDQNANTVHHHHNRTATHPIRRARRILITTLTDHPPTQPSPSDHRQRFPPAPSHRHPSCIPITAPTGPAIRNHHPNTVHFPPAHRTLITTAEHRHQPSSRPGHRQPQRRHPSAPSHCHITATAATITPSNHILHHRHQPSSRPTPTDSAIPTSTPTPNSVAAHTDPAMPNHRANPARHHHRTASNRACQTTRIPITTPTITPTANPTTVTSYHHSTHSPTAITSPLRPPPSTTDHQPSPPPTPPTSTIAPPPITPPTTTHPDHPLTEHPPTHHRQHCPPGPSHRHPSRLPTPPIPTTRHQPPTPTTTSRPPSDHYIITITPTINANTADHSRPSSPRTPQPLSPTITPSHQPDHHHQSAPTTILDLDHHHQRPPSTTITNHHPTTPDHQPDHHHQPRPPSRRTSQPLSPTITPTTNPTVITTHTATPSPTITPPPTITIDHPTTTTTRPHCHQPRSPSHPVRPS